MDNYAIEQMCREILEIQKETYKEVLQNKRRLEVTTFWVLLILLMQVLWVIV
jgi:hypothetical protein